MLTRAEAIAHHGVLVVVIHAKLLQVAQEADSAALFCCLSSGCVDSALNSVRACVCTTCVLGPRSEQDIPRPACTSHSVGARSVAWHASVLPRPITVTAKG
jgi:hypothetical protein